jgi:hypothetical protein
MDYRTISRIRQARQTSGGDAALLFLVNQRGPLVVAEQYVAVRNDLKVTGGPAALEYRDADGVKFTVMRTEVRSVRATTDVEDAPVEPEAEVQADTPAFDPDGPTAVPAV